MAKKTPTPKPTPEPVSVKTAAHDTTPKLMSPAKVAAIAKAEATELVNKQVGGFTNFLREQSVVGVGIGLVFGIQIKAVVDTVMLNLVNPITELILPGGKSLAKQTATVKIAGEKVVLGWGAVVYSLLTFVIVAFIIYAAYKMLKLDRLKKKDK